MMRLGTLHLFENPAGKTEGQIVNDQIELMVEAENLGYESVWPGEHHFSEYGYCGAPQVTLAAVAARTSSIRLGTGVLVLPLHNPIRLAEDFAFLDQISGGRVDLGIGRGYQPQEYNGFGVDQTQSREMFDEAIQLIKACWTEERVTFNGRYYQANDVLVRPKPLQEPHPPIWMAAIQMGTFEKVGRLGFNLMMGFAFGLKIENGAESITAYREGRAMAGLDPKGGKVAAMLQIYVADTMELARAEFAEPLMWYHDTISKFVAPARGAVPGYESYAAIRDFTSKVSYENLLASESLIVGDCEYVAEKLTELAKTIEIDELLCWTRLGGLENSKVLHSMELLSGQVMPTVRVNIDANKTAAATSSNRPVELNVGP